MAHETNGCLVRPAGRLGTFQLASPRMPRHQTVATDTDSLVYDLYEGACEKISSTPLYGWAIILGILYFFGFFTIVMNVLTYLRRKAIEYGQSWKTDAAAVETPASGALRTKSPKIKRFMFVTEDGKPVHPAAVPPQQPSDQQ
jgi:hypothetical protein